MKLKKYDDIKLFWKENQEWLEEKEWYNCLMIGNCLDGVKNGMDHWFLATVENNGVTELIMLYRKPWKLLIYSPTNNNSDEILNFTASEIYHYDKELLGVNAEKDVANTFAKYYCALAKMKYKVHTPLRILLLEKMSEKGNWREDVTFRKASSKDKEVLVKYIKDFTKEALNEEMPEEQAEETFEDYLKNGYYVLEKDQKIVSSCCLRRKMKYGKCISAVYTPQEERKKGYAYNLVYRVSKKQLDEGDKYCVLYTDDANSISNHVYEKIGYKRMEDWENLDFEK